MNKIKCNFNGETYIINEKDKTFIIKLADKETILSFDKMNKIVKETKNVNRVYKPYSLLFFIDYKNKKINNWKNNIEIERVYY